MAMEQLVDLPALYASREFADLTIVALNGEEFHVHRVVLGQHSRLKTLILDAERDNRRVAFMESADSLRLMVRWMYGVPWPGLTENTTKGRAQELKSMVEIAHAAEKYGMTAMARDAYTAAGSVMRTIQSMDDGLRVLRDTTNATATGVLQRTIIDKLLALPKATHDAASQRRVVKGEHDTGHGISSLDVEDGRSEQDSEGPLDIYPKVVMVPKKSNRERKPSEEAREHPTPQKKRKSATTEIKAEDLNELHCVCRTHEDDKDLVQCGQCQKWFHPGCIGKGTSKITAYKNRWRSKARESDEKFYRENEVDFSCLECDDKATS